MKFAGVSRRHFLSHLAAVACIAGQSSVAAKGGQPDLGRMVNETMGGQHVPGLVLTVIKDGTVAVTEGYGVAVLETNETVTPKTIFRIGSISKQFIASSLMLCVERNQIQLDNRIGSYLRDVPESWRSITPRHLLSHTSGLIREPPGYDARTPTKNNAEIIASAYQAPLRAALGDAWAYSNLGYFILAEILSTISGMPWFRFIQDTLFQPSNMMETKLTTAALDVDRVARGYRWHEGQLQPTRNALAIRPSGAFVSTVEDLAKWDLMLCGDRILTSESRALMWTPTTLNNGRKVPYGLGWHSQSAHSHLVVSHSGSQPGFQSLYVRNVSERVSVIVLTNGDKIKLAALCQEILRSYAEDAPHLPINELPDE